MKILIIPNNTENNCYGVRNKLPAEFLLKRGHEINVQNEFKVYVHPEHGKVFDPGEVDWADVVVFNRHYDIDNVTLKNLIQFCRDNGKKVVYETDDLLEALNFSNPMFDGIKKNISQVRMMASMADLCTTTGNYLKEELEKYNSNVKILPNCVDRAKWKQRKGGNKKVRVGYAGGSSHNEDLTLILDVVKDLQQEIDFEFVVFGLLPGQWEESIETLKDAHARNLEKHPGASPAGWYIKTMELDEAFKGIKWTHQPFVPISEYNKKLSELNLDIGLCPLIDNRFNRCKSPIKFYEYAMVGTACLASKVSPYLEEVSYTAKNKYSNWRSKLKALIEDEQLRDKIAAEQKEWVLENRDIRKNVHLWEEAYNIN